MKKTVGITAPRSRRLLRWRHAARFVNGGHSHVMTLQIQTSI